MTKSRLRFLRWFGPSCSPSCWSQRWPYSRLSLVASDFTNAQPAALACHPFLRRTRDFMLLRSEAAFGGKPLAQHKSHRANRDPQHATSSYRLAMRSLQPQRRASETWGTLAPVGRKYDCLERHPTWITAEFLTQSLRQSVDDPIRIDAAARLYLVN